MLKELEHLLPNEDFIFLADQLYLPYGEKNKKELISRVSKITDYFIHQHNIKMMIMACNTATSNTIDDLRKKYSFPIVGTIPAVKVAAEKTKTGTIAVISTVATSKSQALKKLINNYCQSMHVLNIGCKNLVEMVERGLPSVVDKLLLEYLEPVVDSNADYLVLGCTHYPFLKKNIKKIVGRKVKFLDSGKAIAKRARFLLVTNSMVNNQKKHGKTSYFTTLDPSKFSKTANLLLKSKIIAKKAKV